MTTVSDWITAVAALLGVLFAGWQLMHSRLIAQATFEDSLDRQYRELLFLLPLPILTGQTKFANTSERELIYNYFDLSNEQAFLYTRGRISEETWQSWRAGIITHMETPAFKNLWIELSLLNSFTYLRKLI